MVTCMEFESMNVALRGQCVKPLHQQAMMSFLGHYYFNIDKNFFQVFLHTNVSFEILAQNYFLMTLGIRKRRAMECETKRKRKLLFFY
jgi:hypothetical protein